ncbi:MAG: PTS sugar transporter subunit IIA [Clostridiales bacterium]|nr:PTS sugar transporter subunit IIA [Clostridiales bacterium]MCD7829576.1 PTS sugar transporter subunit IIA [Clostridiales bacterium]MCD7886179.1 PTS sugar transporter subunit IIA [Clostridiales bacterium]MCD8334973.1 PTS sugar transporter subunit IIA [Clostridiales bacterium]
MATVLQTIVEKKHYKFIDEPVTWQEAVRLSTESLVADGSVDADYYQQIVDCITKYGPYVVFDHYVAMPHSQENAAGVHKTGIGFMVSKQVVDFGEDEDGEKKEAKLFFTLAACNPDEHLNNIQQLMGVFTNEELLDALMEANTPEDILAAEAKYPCEEM